MIKDPHKGQEVYWITEHINIKSATIKPDWCHYTSSVQKTRIIRQHVMQGEQWCMILIMNEDYPTLSKADRSTRYKPKRWLTAQALYETENEAQVALLKQMIK